MNVYPVQGTVRLTVTFTDPLANNAPVDPTAVVLTLTLPDQTQQTPAPVRDGVGAYHCDTTVSQAGVWIYSWQGTGAVIASSGDGFFRGI